MKFVTHFRLTEFLSTYSIEICYFLEAFNVASYCYFYFLVEIMLAVLSYVMVCALHSMRVHIKLLMIVLLNTKLLMIVLLHAKLLMIF